MAIKIGSQKNKEIDLSTILEKLHEKYKNIFLYSNNEEVFIYRTIGRKEYKDLVDNTDISDVEKEDIVCKSCILWPESYDFDSCEAGLPNALTKEILKNSLLTDVNVQKNCLFFHRDEMYQLDNVITCMIHEAFPTIDIEEIENWDIEKTMKYYSRAEWILANVRGLPLVDIAENLGSNTDNTEEVTQEEVFTEELKVDTEPVPKKVTKKRKKRRKKVLTPEQLSQIMNESGLGVNIDWKNTSEESTDEMCNVDTRPAALRTDF